MDEFKNGDEVIYAAQYVEPFGLLAISSYDKIGDNYFIFNGFIGIVVETDKDLVKVSWKKCLRSTSRKHCFPDNATWCRSDALLPDTCLSRMEAIFNERKK